MEKILNFDSVTEELYKQIDITPTQYKQATAHYEAVANCLVDGGVATDVYPQGSFAFGTVIRPYRGGKDAEFDIDLVAQSTDEKLESEPEITKNAVGQCLAESQYHKDLLDHNEGRRCWTLNYATKDGIGFHMDVLPCVREESNIITQISQCNVPYALANKAIAVTDYDKAEGSYDWSTSNPRGLVEWFSEINAPYLRIVSEIQRRNLVDMMVYDSIDAVPEPLLKSSLQRVIQLFKRHRDVRFDNHPDFEYRPISIIITVLVTQIASELQIYNATVQDLLHTVVDELNQYSVLNHSLYMDAANDLVRINALNIRRDNNGWYIGNPVNPYENFAERWLEDGSARAKTFFNWVKLLQRDFAFDHADSAEMFDPLTKSFGGVATKNIYNSLKLNATKSVPTIITTANQPKPYRR